MQNVMNLHDAASWLLDSWRIVLVGIAVFFTGFAVYGITEARALNVTADSITSQPRLQDLDGIRIVFIADVHAGPLFGRRRMDALVNQVNALEPDVLILGGDYVGGRMNGADIFYPAAAGFRARLAKIAVLGNHDNWENPGEAKQRLTEAGFTVLGNDNIELKIGDATIAVAGVDDLGTGNPDPEAAALGIDENAFSILVSHNPDVFADRLGTTAGDWNLALAGHTHAGQVTFFGATAPIVPSRHGGRYRTGWRTENGTPILVTNGVGAVTMPFRLFARPEINLITLTGE